VAVVANTAAAVVVAIVTNQPQGFRGGVRVNRTPLLFLILLSLPIYRHERRTY
jgi:hypothetical protein